MTSDRQVRWTVRAGAALRRLLASTWRMRSHNSAPLHAARAADRRVIFALWHGELLPLLWQHRGENIAIVISEHRDGEIVARIAESLGYATVRGTMASRYSLPSCPVPGGCAGLAGAVDVTSQASVRTLVLTPQAGFRS